MVEGSMEEVLTLWKLDKYIAAFNAKGISTLKDLININENLFKVLLPDLVQRIKFINRWYTFATEHGREQFQTNPVTFANLLFELITVERITMILESSFVTNGILLHYSRTKKLTDTYSAYVVNQVVDQLLLISERWNSAHYERIAENLIAIFPTELKKMYYSPPIKKSKTRSKKPRGMQGKIPDKFKNLKHLGKLFANNVKKRKSPDDQEQVEVTDQPEVVQNSLKWLDEHEAPEPELLENWEITSEYRQQWINKNKNPTVEAILKRFPALTKPPMPKLISADFERNCSENVKGKGIKSFDEFMEVLCSGFECPQDDEAGRSLKQVLDCEETVGDGRVLTQLKYLVCCGSSGCEST